MRRILLLMAVAAAMAVTMVASAMPAFADGLGPSQCKEDIPGEDFSDQARSEGEEFSGTSNPGTAQSQHPPFVPFGLGCNPTAVVAEP
jgi:hypothetical protein